MKRALWLPAILLTTVSHADQVDDLIKRQMDAQRIPGMTLLVTKDDKVIKRAAYGKADLELDVPMTTDDVLQTGSIGKTFTATVIFQLIEEGKLALTDTLGKRLKIVRTSGRTLRCRCCSRTPAACRITRSCRGSG